MLGNNFLGKTYIGTAIVTSNVSVTNGISSLSNNNFLGYTIIGNASVTGNITIGNGIASMLGNNFLGKTYIGNAIVTGNITVGNGIASLSSNNYFGNVILGNASIIGNLTIGSSTTTALTMLVVNGQISATTYNATSDYRIKKNVKSINYTVDKLNPVIYFNSLTNKEDMGFLANEVQDNFDFLVNGEKDGENYQTLNYIGLIALLTKEVQDLKKRMAILELQIKK